MSIIDRLSQMVRKSATSDSNRKASPPRKPPPHISRKPSPTDSEKSNKSSLQSSVGRLFSRTFSTRGKSSSSASSSAPTTPADRRRNKLSSNGSSNNSTSPGSVDGVPCENMTDAQRMQASFSSYEMRFGATDPIRASLEGISPCTTRVRDSKQTDHS